MASRRTSKSEGEVSLRPPAKTLEGREDQLISLAVDLAEKQLARGDASAQVITHYLKMGSRREQLEQERMRGEIDLQKAKIESLAAQQASEESYKAALEAMRSYAGQQPEDEIDG